MIALSNIYIKYGDRVLYDNIQLIIKEGERIGLIGRNGSGKSTLLKIIAGEIRPDQGQLDIPKGIRIGYLRQASNLDPQKTVREAATEAFSGVLAIQSKMRKLEKELEQHGQDEDKLMELSAELADAHESFRHAGGDQVEVEVEKVLKGLGFGQEDLDQKIATFSGGWKMRVELAKLLLQKPNYLLLDEPTNHLDIESIIWLEAYLQQYPYTVIVVSHDQRFLDRVTRRTIELINGRTYDYRLPYTKFIRHREEERKLQESAYKNQQRVIEQKEKLIEKFRAKSSKAKFAKSLSKQLDRMDRVELDTADVQAIRIRFPEVPRGPLVYFDCKDLGKKYGDNQVFEHFTFKIHRNERIAFVGQNGQGKSTLAKILVGEEGKTSGELVRKDNIFLSYYAQDQADRLDPRETVLETIEHHATAEQRPKLRSMLGGFLFKGEDVDKKVSVLSGGERSRLSLACMLLSPMNLLVLDEPTHHLDIPSKNILKQALQDYHGTLIVVSHDREFLEGLTEKTLEFREGRIHLHAGDIRSFLEKREIKEMRDLEMRHDTGEHESTNAADSGQTYAARRELKKKLKSAERDIERIEKEISEIEEAMLDESFYQRNDYAKTMERYGSLKNKLKSRTEEWENLVVLMEE